MSLERGLVLIAVTKEYILSTMSIEFHNLKTCQEKVICFFLSLFISRITFYHIVWYYENYFN